MATTNEDLNLAKGQDSGSAASGGLKKLVIVGLVVLVLAALGGGAYFFLSGDDSAAVAESGDVAAVAEAEVVVTRDPDAQPIYFALSPAFLINFEQDGRTRYLQVEMQVMSFDQAVIDKVDNNMPAIRNDLLLLLSDQDYPALGTVEGKDALRKQVLDSVNNVIRSKADFRVENVFFTGFVVQ